MITNLLSIITSFGKIGLISLGGGNSMLKLLEYEAVDYRSWVGQEEFIQMVGTTFLFPGLTAVKLAALIGYKAGGILGLILAVTSLNLPGLLLAIGGYMYFTSHTGAVIRKIMIAVQYGALVLLAATTYSIAQGIFKIHFAYPIAVVSIIFFVALSFFNLSPFWGFLLFISISYFLV